MTKFYTEKINHNQGHLPYKMCHKDLIQHNPRKDTGDKPKDYLLGIGGRLQKVFRAKLGLVPLKEGHCNGGMTIQDV